MRRSIVFLLAATLAVASSATAQDTEFGTEDEKTIYTIGLSISQNLARFNLTPAEWELVKMGIEDGLSDRPKKAPLDERAVHNAKDLLTRRVAAAAEVEKAASQEFLAKAAKAKGATKKESGLIYTETKKGKGDTPTTADTVKVNYTGTLIDGTVFDKSVEPATVALNAAIPCWTEALHLMKPGSKAKLVCPSSTAYGDHGAPPKIKPGATLVYEIELLEINKGAAPAPQMPGAGHHQGE